jgi:hypothetical protein
MQVSTILHRLPATLEWMVLFDLEALKSVADARRFREMFFLDPQVDLGPHSHVVLTSAGRFLAPHQESELVDGETGAPFRWRPDAPGQALADRFRKQIALFPVDQAHCFALGQLEPYEPVALYIEIENSVARARTLFSRKPTQLHYELLQAIGVCLIAQEPRLDGCVLHFENELPDHIRAGATAQFTRTNNCNAFFLRHGEIDAELEAGLLRASDDRIAWTRARIFRALESLATAALARPLAMRWDPPPPAEPCFFGDVVPLGIVQGALRLNPESAVRPAVEQTLYAKRLRRLWPFQSNDLETSTDSVLVLLGLDDEQAVADLERFSDGQGGYLPQLAAATASAGKMLFEPEKRHWCQADYATTCLVSAHRKRLGLGPIPATERYIQEGFATRSGLFFGNPYLVDWAVAQALGKDAHALREQLRCDILTSINEDYTFGRFDRPLSTACAILALGALGYHGRALRAAQLALTRFVDSDGLLPVSTPFHSSLMIDGTATGERIVRVEDHILAVSLHVDVHRMIGSAVAAMALCVPRLDDEPDRMIFAELKRAPQPRYACADHVEYATRFGFPPYVRATVARDAQDSRDGGSEV